jgi:uncharacterized OsmC-like protein
MTNRQSTGTAAMIELVWDEERLGTGTSASGASLGVGDGAEWSPTDLLALAVSGCLMRTFLRIAADEHVPVLGYVSTALVDATDEGPMLHVLPCIVVPTAATTPAVLVSMQQAVMRSPVARTVAGRLTVRPDVHQVAPAGAQE